MTLLKNSINKNKAKNISFNPSVKVTLIPSISDYKDILLIQLEIKTIMKISDYQKKLCKEAYKRFLEEEKIISK